MNDDPSNLPPLRSSDDPPREGQRSGEDVGRGRVLVPKSIVRIPTTDLSAPLPEWHGFTRTHLTHYIEFLEHIIEEQGQDLDRLREQFVKPDTVIDNPIAVCSECYTESDAKWFYCFKCGSDLHLQRSQINNPNYGGVTDGPESTQVHGSSKRSSYLR